MGLVILAAIAVLVRATSVRLPLRTFFKFTGLFLFALAVVFAGNGVFELQNAGILITTHLAWMGSGLPMAGIYPNLQVVSVQGLLVLGALLAWAVIPGAALATPQDRDAPAGHADRDARPRRSRSELARPSTRRLVMLQRWMGRIVVLLILGGVV